MGILTQDDAGSIDNANAYIDATFMLAYFEERNIDISDYDVEAIEASIIRATAYMDSKFQPSYVGRRISLIQGTEWPRNRAYDKNGFNVSSILPGNLKSGCAEYAYVELTTDLGLNPEIPQEANGQLIKKKLEDVMGIKESVEYSEDGGVNYNKRYPKADGFLTVLLKSSTGRVIR